MKKSTSISVIAAIWLLIGSMLPAACQNPGTMQFEGKISGLDDKSKIILNRLRGHRETKIAETETSKDGSFIISIKELPGTGQYRLRIDPGRRNGILDFLLTGENLSFSTHADYLTDSIRILKSGINEAWYAYFRLKEDFEMRLTVLEQLLGIYPPDERFFPQIIQEFNLLQDELVAETDKLINRFPNSLLASYIRSDRPVRINPQASYGERQEFLRYNYLNNVDFNDTLLLNTDIFPNKTLSYIMLYRNPRLSPDMQAQEFIAATDNLLPRAMTQPMVFNYLLEYTISGFDQIGQELVLSYIAEYYKVDETCLSNQDSGELQRRMEGYRMLSPGKPAPPLSATDINGNEFEMGKSGFEKTLIVFWASWCPHCTAMMPGIRDLAVEMNKSANASQANKLKVVSISIDHSEKDYLEYLQKNNLKASELSSFWVNICDYKAWEGKIANDYYLYATPTMLLLDANKTIIGKPTNLNEVTGMVMGGK